MTYFRDAEEATSVFTLCLARFFASEDGEHVSGVARALPVPPVLELHLTNPAATLSIDFGGRRVALGPAAESSVRLEIEAGVLHDVLLERLDPVQISRPFEEDRALLEGAPEALCGFIAVAGRLPKHYVASLAEQGRDDLLELPAPPRSTVWLTEGPPRLVIGKRRPWQRSKRAAEPV